MSKIGLVILFILMAGRNYAQQGFFVLIQADNNQPFYVRVEGILISSSAQGHLILSPLKEGVYNITIGFPKQLFPEVQFYFTLYKKDLEFQLKDLGEKGWGLFNPQTQELKMPDGRKGNEPKNHLEGIKKDDAFSRLMAGVVSDTAVMYNTYAMEATLKDSPITSTTSIAPGSIVPGAIAPGKDTAIPKPALLLQTDTAVAVSMESARPAGRPDTGGFTGKTDTAGSAPVDKRMVADSPLSVLQDRSSGKGNGKPIDSTARQADSFAVAGSTPSAGIPEAAATGLPVASSGISSLSKAGAVVKLSERKTTKGVRMVYADHIKGQQADTIVVIIPADSGFSPPLFRPDTAQKKVAARALLINSDCRNFATDYDVDKLRVKMLETGKDEDRILAAHKVFKTKCFNTKQIKALSEVFTADAQKFRFFETAYPFVSDDHFKELSDLLADPVYISKFRTMTGQ